MGMNQQYGKGGQTPPGYGYNYGQQAAAQPMTSGKGGGKAGGAPGPYDRGGQAGPVYGGSWQPGFYGQNTDYFGNTGANYQYNTQQAPSFAYPNAPQYTGAPGGMWWQGNQGYGGGPAPTVAPAPAPAVPAINPAQPSGHGEAWDNYYANAMQTGRFPSSAPTTTLTTPTTTAAPTGHTLTSPTTTAGTRTITPTTTAAPTSTSTTPNLFNRTSAPTATTVPTSTTTGHALTPTTTSTTTPQIIDALHPASNTAMDIWGGSGQLSPVQQAQKNGITDGTTLNLIAAGFLNPDGTPK